MVVGWNVLHLMWLLCSCSEIRGRVVWKELKNNTKHNVDMDKRENFYLITVHDGKLSFCEGQPLRPH